MTSGLTRRPGGVASKRLRWGALLLAAFAIGAWALVAVTSGSGEGSRWDRLFAATNGPHVRVAGLPGVHLEPAARLPGVTASSGPFPTVSTSLRRKSREAAIRLEGRPARRSVVDTPLLAAGSWLRPGGIVVGQSVARRLGLRAGERVRVTSASGRDVALSISGIAAATDGLGSARHGIGVAYALPHTLERVAPERRTHGSMLLLRLSDPGASGTVSAWIARRYAGPQVAVEEWRESRPDSGTHVERPLLAAGGFAITLALAFGLSARAARRWRRRLALAKAAGPVGWSR